MTENTVIAGYLPLMDFMFEYKFKVVRYGIDVFEDDKYKPFKR